MPKACFIAEDGPCTVFGMTFPPGAWVDVTDLEPGFIECLSENPTFDFDDGSDVAEPVKRGPGRPRMTPVT